MSEKNNEEELGEKNFRKEFLAIGIFIGIFLVIFFFTEKPHFEVPTALTETPNDPFYSTLYLVGWVIWTYPFIFLSGMFFYYGGIEKSEICLGISIVCIVSHYILLFIKLSVKGFQHFLNKSLINTVEGWSGIVETFYSLPAITKIGILLITLVTIVILLLIVILHRMGDSK